MAPATGGRRLAAALAALAAGAAGILAVVASEAWIAGLVVLAGPIGAFAILVLVSTAVSFIIAWAYDAREARRGPGMIGVRVRAWIDAKRGSVEQRAAAPARASALLALLTLSVTAGPFLTTIALKLRGGDAGTAYALSFASSVIFSATWVAVYSGGLALVRHALLGG